MGLAWQHDDTGRITRGWYPERVTFSVDDEHVDTGSAQLVNSRLRRSAGRMQRERQRNDGPCACLPRSPAGDSRTVAPAALHQRDAGVFPRQRSDDLQPRRVLRPWRTRSAGAPDPVWLEDAGDHAAERQGRVPDRQQVPGIYAAASAMGHQEQERGRRRLVNLQRAQGLTPY